MTDKQQLLLQEALKLVPFDGWSKTMLKQATENAGISHPTDLNELVTLYLETLDTTLENRAQSLELNKVKVREKIKLLISERILLINKQKNGRQIARKTAHFLACPSNFNLATKSLWATCDLIWRLSGDKSVDFNYYTKRLTLSMVYGSTFAYFLADNSEGYTETMRFLDNRIENVMQFERIKAKTRAWVS